MDTIKLPVHIGKEIKTVNKAIDKAKKIATIAELKDRTKFSKKKLDRILLARSIRSGLSSLNEPIAEDTNSHRESELSDFIEYEALSPEEVACENQLTERLVGVIDTLTPKESEVMKLRFGLIDGVRLVRLTKLVDTLG